MRIGIVGVGRMGGTFGRHLLDHPDVQQLALAGSGPGSAEQLATELEAEPVAGAAELVDRVDALVIAAATAAHPGLIELGAAHGLPIFCEKPIALDLATTDRVIAAVDAAGVTLQVGFHRRFDPGMAALQAAVAGGRLGRLYLLRATSHDRVPSHEAFIPTSGGIFRDLLIHDMDTIPFVSGHPIEEVIFTGVVGPEVYARYDDVGVAAGVMRLAGDVVALVSGSRHNPEGYDVRLEVHGTGGSSAAGWGPRTPLVSVDPDGAAPPRDPYTSFPDRFAAAYRHEIHTFVDVAAGRRPNPCPPQEARTAFVAALAAERSFREHRPVRVEEVAGG